MYWYALVKDRKGRLGLLGPYRDEDEAESIISSLRTKDTGKDKDIMDSEAFKAPTSSLSAATQMLKEGKIKDIGLLQGSRNVRHSVGKEAPR